MNDDQFAKLFKHMEKGFAELHHDIQAVRSELKEDISQVYSLLDAHTSQNATDEQERAAMSLQLDRLEDEVQTLKRKLALR